MNLARRVLTFETRVVAEPRSPVDRSSYLHNPCQELGKFLPQR